MYKSITLRRQPTAREIQQILAELERALEASGAQVTRSGSGSLHFRMPAIWRAPRVGLLAAISSGYATVTAGGGGPWRIRYTLDFAFLRRLGLAATVALTGIGWSWPRLTLVKALALVWLIIFGLPWLAAALRFYQLIRRAAAGLGAQANG